MPRRLPQFVLLFVVLARSASALERDDLPKCPAKSRSCIAIDLWLAGDADVAWLETQLRVANDRLGAIGAGVQVVAVHHLPEKDTRIESVAQRTALGQHGAQAPLRWFVVAHLADAADPAAVRKGVTWRNGEAFWIIESTSGMRWVLAHELGHVLGLPHSSEGASIMNKTPRVWPPPWAIGFTAREQPVMRRTLARLLRAHRLVLVGQGAPAHKSPE